MRLYTGVITGEGGLPVVLPLRCSTPIYGGYNGGGGVTCRVGLAM